MGNLLGSMALGRGRAIRLGLVTLGSPLLLTLAACGEGDGPIADAPPPTVAADQETETGMLPCAEDRHLAVFDLIGFLTAEDLANALGPWGEGDPPTPRAGSVDLVQAYRQQGYEILIVTTIPPEFFGDRTVQDMTTEWLQTNGYPVDTGVHFWGWDGEQRPDGQTWIALTDELLRFASESVSVDVSYTENTDKTYAFATGGVPPEGNYSLTPVEGLGDAAPTSAPTTLIPNDDLVAHTATVQQLAPVCEVA